MLFVDHDALGVRFVRRVCRRIGLSAYCTGLASSLAELNLKIGFMDNPRSEYTSKRLALAAGPFGEELAILCWADRHALRARA